MNCDNEDKCCCNSDCDFTKLEQILAKYRESKGGLIPVLQEAQDAYGYLSQALMTKIGEELNIPTSQIYGVVTFYSQFHLNPRGRNVIRVCQGTACHVRGAQGILETLEDILEIPAGQTTSDLEFTLETVACIGACGLAPVLMINDDSFGRLTKEKAASVLEGYS